MASQSHGVSLPILYNDLLPLSSVDHGSWRLHPMDSMKLIERVHAVPITIDEFTSAQRSLPIVFSSGADPVPLALMGLNEGVNVFVDREGQLTPRVYLPAYVRRYPFMLAQLRPDSDDLSLCFDPSSGLIGDFPEGITLFENGEPAEQVKATLAFCEQFETAARTTGQFMKDLVATGLLEEGEITINNEQFAKPYVYGGFQMVNEEKLRDLRGDQLRKLNQNGMLMLIYSHLFSMTQMSELFGLQMSQGKIAPQM